MANTGFLSSEELDFSTLKSNLKTFLKSQPLLKDYNFEGSNLDVLLDVLSYNTHLNMFYINMVGSEMFLDTATLRESAVSHAKELNYVPVSRSSSKAIADIVIVPDDPNTAPATIELPKYYKVSASGGDSNIYTFTTDESLVLPYKNGVYTAAATDLFEGMITTEYFTVDGTTEYILSSANVDISSLEVKVVNSTVDTTETSFTRAFNLFGIDENSTVFFVQGAHANQYQILFGNGITGQQVQTGNIVVVTYRNCSGTDADDLSNFTAVRAVENYNNVTINTISPSTGGAERETIDSIKFNAPRVFSAQERAITKNDFRVLIKTNFPQIQAIAVYGGEELQEKRYGKVVISTKPYGGEITPDSIKAQIATYLADRTNITTTPLFVDPDYFYLTVNTTVHFDPVVTTLSTSGIESIVRAAISDYNTTSLFTFDADFRYSRFIQVIDGSDKSIVSNDTYVKLTKRITPIIGFDYSTTIQFGNALDLTTQEYILESSLFTKVFSDLAYDCYIGDDHNGALHIYSDTAQGITILQPNIGTINYTTGVVTISSLNVDNYTGHINVSVRLKNKDIIIQQNQILNIDQADITVVVDRALS